MKLAKRLLSLALVAVMLMASCIVVSAAPSYTKGNSHTIKTGVTYTEYSVNGNSTQKASVLEVSPSSGYVPMIYTSSCGSVTGVDKHFTAAKNQGYDIVAAANGGFFNMTYNSVIGLDITQGVIMSAHETMSPTPILAFDKDGTMAVINTKMTYGLKIGSTTTAGISAINKKITFVNHLTNVVPANDPGNVHTLLNGLDRFMYYDANGSTVLGNATNIGDYTGWEVVCEITEGSLSVGGTLKGKVVSATSGKKYRETVPAKNQFVLYAVTGSAAAVQARDNCAVGTVITINPTETIADSKAAMANVNSAFDCHGYIIKNGVDMTASQSSIGNNSVSTKARWTAIGIKADGTYLLWTSEGGATGTAGLTMKEVAQTMLAMGCVNAIRFDGGYSTGMYLSNTGSGSEGFVMSPSRNVCDVLAFVKKTDLKDTGSFNPSAVSDGNILAGLDYEAPFETRGYTASLTDGEAALTCTPGSNNADWYALFQNADAGAAENCPTGIGEITFDLGETYKIDEIKVNIATDYAPEYIKAYVDGTEVGTLTGTSAAGSYWVSVNANGAIGSEIKIEVKVKSGAYWAMFNEVKAYGEKFDGNILAGLDYDAPFETRGYTASLTDGEAALSCTPGSNNAQWYALFQNADAGAAENCPTGVGEIIFSLGKNYAIDEITVNIATDYAPEYVKAYIDGELVGTLTGTSATGSYWISIDANGAIGSELKIEVKVKSGAYWAMFNEIKAYGTVSSGSTTDPGDDRLRGDVNDDGVVDKKDYAALKRFCFETMTLTGDSLLAADVNSDGNVDKKDYAALKRACFGTWNITDEYI